MSESPTPRIGHPSGTVGLLIAAATLLGACYGGASEDLNCTSDDDCSGDAVCSNGYCVADDSEPSDVSDDGETDDAVADARDGGDVRDVEDVSDVGDVRDAEDVADVADARDADATDAVDARDTRDADDVADTRDVEPEVDGAPGDTGDAEDARDTSPDGGDADAGPPTFGPGTVVDYAEVDPSCCRDIDNDGQTDNSLGEALVDFAKNFDNYDLNPSLQNAIADNDIVQLFEFENVSSIEGDQSLTMNAFPGEDATPNDSSDDFVEDGSPYLVDPSGLDANGDPKSPFSSAQINFFNQLVAYASELPFTVPLINARQMTVTIENVELRAQTKEPASLMSGGYINLFGGEISGTVSKDEVFSSINDLAGRACSCLGGDKLFVESSADEWTCNDPPDACSGQGGVAYMCDPNACSNLVEPFLNDAADLNRNPSPVDDHYSIGIRFTSSGASIQGIASSSSP